jgi:hypothetical protein
MINRLTRIDTVSSMTLVSFSILLSYIKFFFNIFVLKLAYVPKNQADLDTCPVLTILLTFYININSRK